MKEGKKDEDNEKYGEMMNLSNPKRKAHVREGVRNEVRRAVSAPTTSPGKGNRFGPKVGQISPKWTKPGFFSDQIQYNIHFGEPKCTKSDVKNSRNIPILGQTEPLWVLNLSPCSYA